MIELGQQFGLYVIKEVVKADDVRVCCRAEDPFFNREVALKVHQIETEESLPQVEKLLERLAVLDHPSIAPVYDSGIQEDCFYFTSAYYAGGSLAEQFQEPIFEERALQIIAELTQALDYALTEGVGQGQVELEKIYFDAEERAVFADFGLATGLERITQSATEAGNSEDVPDSVAVTLRSIGELLLRMLLGPAADLDERIDDLVARVENPIVRRLVGRFMLPGEWRFASYSELLDELLGFNEVAKRLRLEPAMKNFNDSVTLSGPPLSAADDEETQDTITEIRRLVAEKNDLQQKLDKVLYERNLADNKITESSRELAVVKKLAAKAQEEANVAWELVAGQKYERYRPAAWAVGGFVLGFLISGSYGYYYSEQTRNELLAKLQANEELIKSATWQPVQTVNQPQPIITAKAVDQKPDTPPAVIAASSPPGPLEKQEEQPSDERPVHHVVATPVAEKTVHWWPAGNEFSAAAAIPIEQIKVALGFKVKSAEESLSEQLREEALSAVQRWADAWESQDLSHYFSCYSEKYRPELGRSQQEWREMRRTRVSRPQWIKLNLDDISLRQVDDDRIQVKLKQSYSSDYYQDQILKSINLIKEEGEWRILMERSLGMISDIVGG